MIKPDVVYPRTWQNVTVDFTNARVWSATPNLEILFYLTVSTG